MVYEMYFNDMNVVTSNEPITHTKNSDHLVRKNYNLGNILFVLPQLQIQVMHDDLVK